MCINECVLEPTSAARPKFDRPTSHPEVTAGLVEFLLAGIDNTGPDTHQQDGSENGHGDTEDRKDRPKPVVPELR
jgi:hypothetical protein